MSDQQDPKASFSPKAQAEIEAHRFAAKTGGLVSLSAPTFWELYDAAVAWHEHQKSKGMEDQQIQEELDTLDVLGVEALMKLRAERRARKQQEQQSATAT